jgi:hypothetical protein
LDAMLANRLQLTGTRFASFQLFNVVANCLRTNAAGYCAEYDFLLGQDSWESRLSICNPLSPAFLFEEHENLPVPLSERCLSHVWVILPMS